MWYPRLYASNTFCSTAGGGIVKLLTLLPSPCHQDHGDAPSQTKPTSGAAAAMTPPADPAGAKHHRLPGDSISHGVWLS